MCIYTSLCLMQVPVEALDPWCWSYRWLWNELKFSGRAASALNHWTIPSTSKNIFLLDTCRRTNRMQQTLWELLALRLRLISNRAHWLTDYVCVHCRASEFSPSHICSLEEHTSWTLSQASALNMPQKESVPALEDLQVFWKKNEAKL